MKPRNWLDSCRAAVLGALNGLLFGIPIEMLRVWHDDIVNRRGNDELGFDVTYSFQVLTPLLCALIFGLSSYLIYRLRTNYPRFLLLRWQFIGFISATCCVIFDFINTIFFGLWSFKQVSWAWVVCLAVVVPINLIFGIIVDSSARLYSSENKREA